MGPGSAQARRRGQLTPSTALSILGRGPLWMPRSSPGYLDVLDQGPQDTTARIATLPVPGDSSSFKRQDHGPFASMGALAFNFLANLPLVIEASLRTLVFGQWGHGPLAATVTRRRRPLLSLLFRRSSAA